HGDGPPFDEPMTGDDAVAEGIVRVARRLGQRADLLECARVEQRFDACAGTGPACRLPLLDRAGTARFPGRRELLAELVEFLRRGRHLSAPSSRRSGPPSSSIPRRVRLMCAPTFAMYGSST